MSRMTIEKQTAINWVTANERFLSDFNREIWDYAETAFREYKSAKAYCDLLREEGFEVMEGTGGMPTAFMATFGEGRPVLGSYVEYDAVPGYSQKAVPYKTPRDGLHPYAAGHTDPHSALGVGALAGILATKEVMKKHNLKGTLKLFGEPAEKVCASKPAHAAKGYYDDLDAAIGYHPTYSAVGNTVEWETLPGSFWSIVFTFECVDPETWISPDLLTFQHAHAKARCPAALDAICLMYTTTKYTKEAMFPRTGLWSINEYILVGGQCTSDNLPPRIAQIQYGWRSPSLAIQKQIYQVLENNAKHVAEITHCKLSTRWVTKTRVGLANNALAELVYRNMELVGPTKYGEEAKKVGREIQKNCGVEPMENPFEELSELLVPPKEHEARIREGLPSWERNFSSDDYVEYTWHTPTARLRTARASLKPPSPSYSYPFWTFCAMGGIRSTIDPAVFVAGKTIAASMVELLMEPAQLKKAQDEFKERTGGGIGGSKWVAPLLPSDFKPAVDLRWPEYVSTARGEEWWIPNPA